MTHSKKPDYLKIKQISEKMKGFKIKEELGTFIAEELLKYRAYDLQVISARAREDVETLPEPYRTKLLPYAKEWFFGRYHRVIMLYRRGDFKNGKTSITDFDTYLRFCGMIPKGCFDSSKETHRFVDEAKKPYYELFFYLLCAFAMFVEDEPGHPPGTPFPGGFEVQKNGDGYLCPIRDKEEEIFYSVCNFCPAKQDERNQ
ncbi:MAG: DUF2115 domain-containing protein [Methanomicrobium sp.]|nr:DUF2115 domain-containing protein [Methanomicrobium sp.]MDD4299895.1 DUF2115 domain-containing protein [Methanomicrobium sp.]